MTPRLPAGNPALPERPPERRSPWKNGYIESLNARMRDKLQNGEIFYTLKEAQILIESSHCHFNPVRPHSNVRYRPPREKIGTSSWPPNSAPLRRPPRPAERPSMHQNSKRTSHRGPFIRPSGSARKWQSFEGASHFAPFRNTLTPLGAFHVGNPSRNGTRYLTSRRTYPIRSPERRTPLTRISFKAQRHLMRLLSEFLPPA